MSRSVIACAAFLAAAFAPVAAFATNIGDVSEYLSTIPCHRAELVVPNGHGLVATMRHVSCAIWGGPPDRQYFVFIHGPNEPDSEKNLVLSFVRSDQDERADIAPAVIWRSGSQLWIGSGNRGDVHYFRGKLDATSIAYQLGSEISK